LYLKEFSDSELSLTQIQPRNSMQTLRQHTRRRV